LDKFGRVGPIFCVCDCELSLLPLVMNRTCICWQWRNVYLGPMPAVLAQTGRSDINQAAELGFKNVGFLVF